MDEIERLQARSEEQRMATMAKSFRRKALILNKVEDLVGELFYYGRKGDSQLPPGDIEEAVQAGEITVIDIVSEFGKRVAASCKSAT